MFAIFSVAGSSAIPMVTLNNGVQMPAVAAGLWQYDKAFAEISVRVPTS